MAKRRMFSLDVVDTDAFLDLPASSQCLYFHLGMRADDDGFGDIVPGMAAFSDFFDQLTPFMEEYGRERAEENRRRVERYTKKYQKNDDKTVPDDRG